MATLLRPPLVFPPQVKRWVGTPDAYPNLSATTLKPAAYALPLSAGRVTESAPPRKAAVTADVWPNLALILSIDTTSIPIGQVYGDAPARRPRLSVDTWPNLLQTTLGIPLAAFALPLSAQRVDQSAPPRKNPVTAEQLTVRAIWRDPVPRFGQWTESAPQRKRVVQVDVYPNMTVLGINPNAKPLQSSESAPPPKRPVYVDVYPNLLQSTLANPPTAYSLPLAALRMDFPAPPPKYMVRIDQPMQRPVWLDPVPGFQQLNDSAPWGRIRTQVDTWPNMLPLGINPNAQAVQLTDSAPPRKRPVYVDVYPNLTVSTLLALVSVPNVVGETQAQATTDITGVGLAATVTTDYSDTIAAGLVISQAPSGGTIVPSGSAVAIVISLGIQPKSADAGRKTQRKRYYVEIDGQQFEVDGPEHARALLDRAREVAALHARELAEQKVSRETIRKTGKRPIALPTPRITSPNPELREVVQAARKQINELYRSTAIDTELALLMARQLELEDEEEALLLLM